MRVVNYNRNFSVLHLGEKVKFSEFLSLSFISFLSRFCRFRFRFCRCYQWRFCCFNRLMVIVSIFAILGQPRSSSNSRKSFTYPTQPSSTRLISASSGSELRRLRSFFFSFFHSCLSFFLSYYSPTKLQEQFRFSVCNLQ